MTWPVIVCLIVGLVFVMIEIFQPGFGVFGTVGLLLLILGVVLRVIFVRKKTMFWRRFYFIVPYIVNYYRGFIIMVKSSKMGWLSRSPFIEKSTAVSPGISEGTKDYTYLKDKIGYAATDLKPTGKINIDGVVEDAYAEGFFIKKGEGIKVVDVKGGKITVRRIE